MLNGKSVVYTSGTYDLFHSNHIKMIEYARGLGEILIIGVNTDELVCSYKNPPAIPFKERLEIIKALKYPDLVIPQHSWDHASLVKKLNIDAFVLGDDWYDEVGYLAELGVKVFYFPYGLGVSSSKIKEKIFRQYSQLEYKADKKSDSVMK